MHTAVHACCGSKHSLHFREPFAQLKAQSCIARMLVSSPCWSAFEVLIMSVVCQSESVRMMQASLAWGTPLQQASATMHQRLKMLQLAQLIAAVRLLPGLLCLLKVWQKLASLVLPTVAVWRKPTSRLWLALAPQYLNSLRGSFQRCEVAMQILSRCRWVGTTWVFLTPLEHACWRKIVAASSRRCAGTFFAAELCRHCHQH